MGRALAETSPAAAAVFAAADDALGEAITALAWDGPAELLDRTENAQPALLAASMAILAGMRERWAAAGPRRAAARGSPPGTRWASTPPWSRPGVVSLADGIRLVRERGRLMQASGDGRDGAMAALIGLDDASLPELVAGASAHGIFVVANRNAPGQVVVSGERAAIEAGAELAKSARRQAGDRAAGLGRRALAADGRGRGRDAPPRSPASTFHDPRRPAARERRRPTRSRPPRRAAPSSSSTSRPASTGSRAVERMTADGVDDLRRGRPGQRPDRPHQAHRPGRRDHRRRRPRHPRPTARPRQAGLTSRTRTRRSHPLRRPDYDRRVVVTGLGVISPVGNDVATAWANLTEGRTGLGPITRFDPSPYEAKLAGEVNDFDGDRVDGRQGGPPERVEHAFRGRRGQAGARGLRVRAHGREPHRGRRHLRVGRRRADDDDRQLHRAPRARTADRSRRRSSRTRWWTAAPG